jgi:hypothetical protein
VSAWLCMECIGGGARQCQAVGLFELFGVAWRSVLSRGIQASRRPLSQSYFLRLSIHARRISCFLHGSRDESATSVEG